MKCCGRGWLIYITWSSGEEGRREGRKETMDKMEMHKINGWREVTQNPTMYFGKRKRKTSKKTPECKTK